MIYGSVCSGIEAASVAWHPLGWRAAFLSEIEPFPRAVLAHHYPTVPLHGDFTTIQPGMYEPIELLVGGTPCQSFSVAGLRSGLDDERGNLALQFLKLAHRLRPRWVVWENVPGVLSSNGGRDFGAILGGLVELGYGFAYRVLDAQFFGVPQRRRRVFVVGCLGDWRRAVAVLFERHSLSGHPAPRREAGQAAPTIPSRSTAGGGLGTDFDCDGGLDEPSVYCPDIVPQAMSRKWAKGSSGPAGDEVANLIAHALRADGFDASEDGTGRGTPLVPVPIQNALRGQDQNGLGVGGDVMFTLDQASQHGVAIPFDTTQMTSAANYSRPRAGDPCHPLAAGAHPPAVAIQGGSQQDQFCPPDSVVPTLAHSSNVHAGHHQPKLWQGMAVRRLTPEECEALQGFPRGYTLVPCRGKPAADGPRYKALGNSMAVPVMAWIGQRIQMVDGLTELRGVA